MPRKQMKALTYKTQRQRGMNLTALVAASVNSGFFINIINNLVFDNNQDINNNGPFYILFELIDGTVGTLYTDEGGVKSTIFDQSKTNDQYLWNLIPTKYDDRDLVYWIVSASSQKKRESNDICSR